MRIQKGLCRRIAALMLVLMLLTGTSLAQGYLAGVTADSMLTYSDAGLKKPMGVLPQYTVVSVTGEQGNVLQLMLGGKTFYAEKGALKKLSEESIPAVVNRNTRVYLAPDAKSYNVALKRGSKVNVLYVNDAWAMIERSGNVGYAPIKDLDMTYSSEAVDDPFLPAPANVGTSSGVVIETYSAVTSTAKLPVYQSANTKSPKLGTLKKDDKVTVHAYNKNWAYISKDGKYGFCALNGLTAQAEVEEVVDPLSGGVKVTVIASSVKVYEKASSSSKKLGTLKQGMTANRINNVDNWSYIELNGRYGYCAADALSTEDAFAPSVKPEGGEVIDGKSPMGIATVVAPTAPAYEKMSTNAGYITLKLGESLYFYGYDSKWILVGKDGAFRFVPRKSLSAESYAELQSEDSGAAVEELQGMLLSLGYLDSVPGTNYSSRTVDAVKRLQAACGMEQTGKADVALLRVLHSGYAPLSPMLSVSLASGSKGESTTRLQTRLFELGYFSRPGSIDGVYGSNTTAAVRLFQKTADLSVTGKADNATIRALYKSTAPKLEAGLNAADSAAPSSGSSGNTTQVSDALASDTAAYSPDMSVGKKLEHVIYVAQQQLGKKYVFGATGLSSFDCSGLTMYAFKQVGVSLPHSAYSQGYNNSRQKISGKSSLRRGDLVFFNTVSDGDQCDHVGIYLGNNSFIHASSGAGKVVISDLSSGYYSRVYSWGRRVLG